MQKDIHRLKNAARINAAMDDDPNGDVRMETEELGAEQRQRAQCIDLDNTTLHVVCFPSFLDLSST